MDISQILLSSQSPDHATRTQAEEHLRQAREQNAPMFFVALATELNNESKAKYGRQAAGLYLKNLLDAKDAELQQKKSEMWRQMDPNARGQVKQLVLQTLHSAEDVARHTAAQVVAKIGSIEMRFKEWNELLPTLLGNVTGNADEGTMHATLEALGYLCEELEDGVVDQNQTNQILTAIVDGIRKERPDKIRAAAATALKNSLEFAKENMNRDQERNVIMQVICEATSSSNIKVRVVAYECIVQIASLYYDKLQPYMETLYQLTFHTVRNDVQEVALQAIEFWSTICDEEMDLLEEERWSQIDTSVPSERLCQNYIKLVVQHLVPLLTETLTKQEEIQDDDTWNLAMAGATCLGLVAQTIGDDVVKLAMDFVTPNIQSPDWRKKEAAIMCFGSILEGPSDEILSPLVDQAMMVLLQCMQDKNVMVRDTAAWAIGRICELHAQSISENQIRPLFEVLMKGLDDVPRVASNVCYAIHNLAQAFEESDDGGETNILSAYFLQVLQKLLTVTERADWNEHQLRAAAYEAVNMMIQAGAPDTHATVVQMLPVIIERLNRTFQAQIVSQDDKEEVYGLQALLCGVLQVCTQKLEKEIKPSADFIMASLLNVFQSKDATAHEEAFMAAGALANAVEADFEKYMNAFFPSLCMGLRTYEEYMVCQVAVGVVGDVCRALDNKILPYCDNIVTLLLENLQSPYLNRSVKPPVFSAFGDIALAIGGNFEKYLAHVMAMLHQAQMVAVASYDEDFIEYMNQLREGMLEAYTGIIQGLGSGNKLELLFNYIPSIVEFLEKVADDINKDDSVTRACVGLIGDIASSYGNKVAPLLKRDFVQRLFIECSQHDNDSSQKTVDWARAAVNALRA